MDSDDIFYGIFVVATIVFSILNSIKKGKQNTSDKQQDARSREVGQRRQSSPPPVVPNAKHKGYRTTDRTPGLDINSELKKMISGALGIPQQSTSDATINPSRDMGKRTSPPPISPMQKQYFIETPDQEGESVTEESSDKALETIASTNDKVDEAYTLANTSIPNNSRDWRKAIIAHEVLKRKF